MRALMVVDIDHGDYWGPEMIQNNKVKKQVLLEIKRVLRFTRKEGLKRMFVILISILGDRGQQAQICRREKKECKIEKTILIDQTCASSCIICDIPDWRVSEELEHQHNDDFEPAFIKSTENAFTNKELLAYVQNQGIREIVLAGCNTSQCILSTAQGAVKNGFDVLLLEDCTFPPFWSQNEKEDWIRIVEGAVDNAAHTSVSVRIAHSQMIYPEYNVFPPFL